MHAGKGGRRGDSQEGEAACWLGQMTRKWQQEQNSRGKGRRQVNLAAGHSRLNESPNLEEIIIAAPE